MHAYKYTHTHTHTFKHALLRAPVVPSLQSGAAIASGQAVAHTLPMRRACDACSQQSVAWILQVAHAGAGPLPEMSEEEGARWARRRM